MRCFVNFLLRIKFLTLRNNFLKRCFIFLFLCFNLQFMAWCWSIHGMKPPTSWHEINNIMPWFLYWLFVTFLSSLIIIDCFCVCANCICREAIYRVSLSESGFLLKQAASRWYRIKGFSWLLIIEYNILYILKSCKSWFRQFYIFVY